MHQTDEYHKCVRDQLRWSTQALALDATMQQSLFPHFVCKLDEFASISAIGSKSRAQLPSEFSIDQFEALHAIDVRLEWMSRGGNEFDQDLWTDNALKVRPEWEELRCLARLALVRLCWPLEVPPWGRSEYLTRGPFAG